MVGRATVTAIYITEAHAQDEWPISSSRYTPDRQPIIVNQPKTSQARITLAQQFVAKFDCRVPTLVDPIEDPFMHVRETTAPSLLGKKSLYEISLRNFSFLGKGSL